MDSQSANRQIRVPTFRQEKRRTPELSTSHTRSITYTFSHQYTIDDFSVHTNEATQSIVTSATPAGDNVLRSSRFSPKGCESLQFYLKLYPMGYKAENKEYVSFFLCFVSNEKSELTMKYSVHIIDVDGNKKNSLHIAYHKVTKGRGLGIPQYILRDNLMDPSNGFLHDDKLTIFCDIKILYDQVTETPFELAEANVEDQYIRSARRFSRLIAGLLESRIHCDVTLVVCGQEIQAHKAILAAISPVFNAMFTENYVEGRERRVEIDNIAIEVFEEMLKFIYSATVNDAVLETMAVELLEAADMYDISSLKEICCEHLISSIKLSTVSQLLILADRHSVQPLKSACIDFITCQPNAVVNTAGWASIKNTPELAMQLFANLVSKAKPSQSVATKRSKTTHSHAGGTHGIVRK